MLASGADAVACISLRHQFGADLQAEELCKADGLAATQVADSGKWGSAGSLVQHTQSQAFTQRHAVATWPSPVNAIIS